jgi:hypothetical protein
VSSLPDPVLFIGGAPRSGTTLLRNMVAAHPDLAVPDESYFIRTVWAELVRRRCPDDLELAWDLIRRERFFKQWKLDPARVDEMLAAHPPDTYPDLIRVLFAAHAASVGKPLSADKTPSHAHNFDWLAARFPGTRFVHVLRDVREVCTSLSVQPWHHGGIAEAAWEWMSDVRRARRAVVGLTNRFIEVRYEDLVARPEAELRRLCEFAEIPFSEAMLDYPRSAHLLLDGHHTRSRGLPQPGARYWQDELEPDDIALIELIAGRTMDEVGYECVTDWPRMRVRAQRLRHNLKRQTRRRREEWLRARAPAVGAALHGIASRRTPS